MMLTVVPIDSISGATQFRSLVIARELPWKHVRRLYASRNT